jgi:hypothetical protein
MQAEHNKSQGDSYALGTRSTDLQLGHYCALLASQLHFQVDLFRLAPNFISSGPLQIGKFRALSATFL